MSVELTIQTGSEVRCDRQQLIDLWVAVTNAGGAVGFRPPVAAADVAVAADDLLASVAAGERTLVTATEAGRLVGTVAIVPGTAAMMRHRVTLVTLMVAPDRQGVGLGRLLVERAHEAAVDRYAARLALVGVRGGQGLEPFYERLGYATYAVLPGGVRFGDAVFDDVGMFVHLGSPAPGGL